MNASPPTPPPAPQPRVSLPQSLVLRWSNLSTMGVVVTRLEVALAVMFLYAAKQKVWTIGTAQNFSDSVKAFKVPVGGDLGIRLATSITPWVEIVASVLLLLGIWSRAAASVLSLMLVAFIALIAQAIYFQYDLECGCFGDLSPFCPKKLGWCNIVQNSVMLAMGLVVAMTPRDKLARSARLV